MKAGAVWAERLFPLWVLLFTGWALRTPELFTPVKPHIPLLLGIIMAGMGMTLTAGDFRAVAARPRAVGLGLAAQFICMPLLAFGLARAMDLPPAIAAGLILVGTCPGGTASNVIAYLARGDVALSVSMTLASTLVAPFATPWLTSVFAGQYVPIDTGALFLGTVKIVVLPLAVGFAGRRWFEGLVVRVLPALPGVSIAAIVAIIACVVALNEGNIRTVGPLVIAAVVLHNALGLAAGYAVGLAAGVPRAQRITLSIEVGMQNSGLAVALATQFLPAGAALAGALFSAWHNLSGSLVAALWSRRADAPAQT